MLGNILNGGFGVGQLISSILIYAVILLTALPIHEAAHALVAYKLGDPTAKNQGRLTLNPFVHLDLMGSVSLILFGIGWAKPVPINAFYFKNRKKGMAISAAAGPLSNLLLAFVSMIMYKLCYFFLPDGVVSGILMMLFYISVTVNVTLAVFNMLPIPPFDGSRIAAVFLPEKIYFGIMKYERYIMLGMMLLLFTGVLSVPLAWLRGVLFTALDYATFFVDRLARIL